MALINRFSRELILAAILLSGLAAMKVWAGTNILSSRQNIAGVPMIVNVEKTYFDRFRETLEDEIKIHLSKSMSAPIQDFSVQLDSLRVTPSLPEFSNYNLQVLGLGSEGATRLDGMVSLTVMVGTGRTPLEFNVSGIMKVNGPAVIAKENLPRGRLIEAGVLETKILPWKTLPTGAAGISMGTVIGRRVKSFVGAGAPVWSGVLEEQVAIRAGDIVDITVLSGPGVIIHSKGVARAEGRVGEQIRIEQPDTRKSLSATVVGEKAVEVRL